MKIMIEVCGGLVTNVTTTEPASIYIVDHDVLNHDPSDEEIGECMEAAQPDYVCGGDAEFLIRLADTLAEYGYGELDTGIKD